MTSATQTCLKCTCVFLGVLQVAILIGGYLFIATHHKIPDILSVKSGVTRSRNEVTNAGKTVDIKADETAGTKANTNVSSNAETKADVSSNKPLIVFGILTSENARENRDAQRNTWIKSALQMRDNLPFRLTYMFMFDKPSAANLAEKKLHNDILYLNNTHTGRGVKFGEKLYNWWKYVYKTYPEAELAARIDDDVALCVPQIFQRLFEVKSSKLYYGWAWGKRGEKVVLGRHMDEMFVVLGRDIIERVAKRKYCEKKKKCDQNKDLVDLGYGGMSMAVWFSIYPDIDFRPDNERITFLTRGVPENKLSKNLHPHFCDEQLIYHKSNPQIMKKLNEYNMQALARRASGADANDMILEGSTSGRLFSGNVDRRLPQRAEYNTQPQTMVKDDGVRSCDKWAVVTTIFSPSEAVTHLAKYSDWCLVIVADTQTPDEKAFMQGLDSKRIKYLSTMEQGKLFPTLSDTIPVMHFGRKNIGYIYAMQHKATVIWDFDDDNIGIIDLKDIMNTTRKFVTACEGFTEVLLNPYPYFGVREKRAWPRGLPLQRIKDWRTIPKICPSKSQPMDLGVVQSLANVQPDVDAIYRLTRSVPFNFKAKRETHQAFVVPRNVYSPFNAQATLWMKNSFLYMALPLTVNGRVSDIWRSYVALHFMHKNNVSLAFTHPYVVQKRNVHNDIKDFNAERHLYERSHQLVAFLSSKEARNVSSIMNMYEQLYQRNYIQLNDLNFIDAWIKIVQRILTH